MLELYEKWHTRWMNRHPAVRIGVLAIILAAVAWYGGRPVYRAAKYWWQGRYLAKAKAAAEEGRMEEARDLSQTVLRAGDPRVLDALRVLEKSMRALNDPMRVDVAKALISNPQGSESDRLQGFRLLASDAPLGWVGQGWVNLPEDFKKKPEFALPFADRLLDGKRLEEAVSVLNEIPGGKDSWEVRRRLIRVLILDGSGQSLAEALRRIDKQWPADDKAGGLELLESIPVERLRPDLLPWAAKRLDSTVARDALMLARLDFASEMAGRPAVVDSAVAKWRESAPMDVARFLMATGMYDRLTGEFPPAQTAHHPGMIDMQLQAAARNSRWGLAKEYLDTGSGQLDKLALFGWRSAVYSKTGDHDAAESAWREAILEADNNSGSGGWLRLAGIMRETLQPARENQAMLEAVLRGRGRLPMFADLRPLLNSLAHEGREKALTQVCMIYLLFEPGNPVLLTNYAYLACITGAAEPSTLARALASVAEAYPELPQTRCVLTAIDLAAGDTEGAKAVAATVKTPLESLPAGYRTAIAAARVAAGEIGQDDPAVTTIPWAQMMPAERRFFGRFLPAAESAAEKAPAPKP